MAAMATERITVIHPDTGGSAVVTRRAFDLSWSKRGWQELTSDADDTAALDALTKPQLVAIAEEQGVPVASSDTKAEILSRLESQED